MKKIALTLGIALSLGLASCNEFDLPNPPGQSNPEVPVFNTENLEIKQAAETLDLVADNEAGKKVTIADITKLVDFPAAYNLLFEVDFATTEDFSDAVTIPAELNDTTLIQLEPNALNSLIYKNFTKDPAEITLHARYAAYATLGDNTKQRLGGADHFYATDYTYVVLPFKPSKVIEGAYYLLQRPVGGTSWDVTSALPMTHTTGGSVYDNPKFSIKIDVTDAGTEWAVIPGSSFAAANLDNILGPTHPEEMSGTLSGGETFNAGVITEASPYTITVNMEQDTYEVALAFEHLWVPGQGSSTTNFSKMLQLSTTNYINYSGVARLRNAWYLTGQPSNTGVVYTLGQDESNVPVVDEKTGVETGHIFNDAQGLKMKAENGLYYLDVNLATLTYTKSPIETISAIGAFNDWKLETAVDLTHSSNFLTWTVKGLDLPAGEIKFCVNHEWTLSFGGAFDDLVQNGGNLNITEAGKYDVTIDFSKLPNTVKFVKK